MPRPCTELPAGLSVDATAALEAGLLPCLTNAITHIGSGPYGSPVWCRPNSYPGVAVCCRELLLLGPVDQAAAVVAALGMRLRGAVVELGAAMHRRPGQQAAPLRADTLREVMSFTSSSLAHLFLDLICPDSAGQGGLEGGWEAGGAAAGDAAPAGGAATDARFEQFALRASNAVTTLLPPLSHAVVRCGELARKARELGAAGGQRMGYAWREICAEGAAELEALVGSSVTWAMVALRCSMVLVAKLFGAAAVGEHSGSGNGVRSGNGGGGSCSSGGGGGDAEGHAGVVAECALDEAAATGATAAAGNGSPWRDLLLREVQLMQLLSAALEMYQVAATAPVVTHVYGEMHTLHAQLRALLSPALVLSAAAFPAEFRAAAAHALGAAAAGDSGAGPAGRAQPCISLPEVHAMLGSEGADGVSSKESSYVGQVLGGLDPAPQEVFRLAVGYCWPGMQEPPARQAELLQMLQPPAEACSAVAAAGAAGTAAAGCGPGPVGS